MSDEKDFYICTIRSWIAVMKDEFKRHYEYRHTDGWVMLYNTLVEVESELDRSFYHFQTDKSLFWDKPRWKKLMTEAMSMAKDLLGSHYHIYYLWQIKRMILNYDKKDSLTFADFNKLQLEDE